LSYKDKESFSTKSSRPIVRRPKRSRDCTTSLRQAMPCHTKRQQQLGRSSAPRHQHAPCIVIRRDSSSWADLRRQCTNWLLSRGLEEPNVSRGCGLRPASPWLTGRLTCRLPRARSFFYAHIRSEIREEEEAGNLLPQRSNPGPKTTTSSASSA